MLKSLFDIFATFFKIGLFTFGGGYAMLPMIEADVVDKKHWMEKKEFVDMLAIVQSVPGAIAINTSIYVGYKHGGFIGALAAILGTVLPSFIIILLIAMVFTDIQDNPTVEKVFKGMRPAVVALIAAPLINARAACRKEMPACMKPIPNDPLTFTDARIKSSLRSANAELLILDPLFAYIGCGVNLNSANRCQ